MNIDKREKISLSLIDNIYICFELRKTCEYTTFFDVPLSVHINRLSVLPTLEHAT